MCRYLGRCVSLPRDHAANIDLGGGSLGALEPANLAKAQARLQHVIALLRVADQLAAGSLTAVWRIGLLTGVAITTMRIGGCDSGMIASTSAATTTAT